MAGYLLVERLDQNREVMGLNPTVPWYRVVSLRKVQLLPI